MSEIFISYASEDKPVAKSLAAVLHERGLRVFWDRAIGPGAEWSEEIQRELRNARCVIVLWSAASANSLWVGAKRQPLSRGEPTFRY
jgi:hypothetical protein